MPTEKTATATDGHYISVCGNEELTLKLWGTTFVAPVRVAENLPSRVLIRTVVDFGAAMAWS